MQFKTATLLYNPQCGKKKGATLARQFSEAWSREFPDKTLALRESTSAENFAVHASEHYVPNNALILMGGDGTFSLGLSALFSAQREKKNLTTPIGLLPAGSGNSFLREFDIHDFETAQERLFSALKQNNTLEQDSAGFTFSQDDTAKTRYFINIWSIGLVSDINLLAGKLGKAYTLASLLKIPAHKRYTYTLTVDGKTSECICNFIAVSNSKYTGGKMLMAPMASTSDGLLDAIIPSLPNRFALFNLFPKIFSGEHIKSPQISHFTFKTLQIQLPQSAPVMLDGEMDVARSIDIQILPKSWKLLMSPS